MTAGLTDKKEVIRQQRFSLCVYVWEGVLGCQNFPITVGIGVRGENGFLKVY